MLSPLPPPKWSFFMCLARKDMLRNAQYLLKGPFQDIWPPFFNKLVAVLVKEAKEILLHLKKLKYLYLYCFYILKIGRGTRAAGYRARRTCIRLWSPAAGGAAPGCPPTPRPATGPTPWRPRRHATTLFAASSRGSSTGGPPATGAAARCSAQLGRSVRSPAWCPTQHAQTLGRTVG